LVKFKPTCARFRILFENVEIFEKNVEKLKARHAAAVASGGAASPAAEKAEKRLLLEQNKALEAALEASQRTSQCHRW